MKINYQEDFLTPGIFPSFASSRKQIRQRPKSLMNPCFLPHLKQRLTSLVENFGFFCARAITDCFAIDNNKVLAKDTEYLCVLKRINLSNIAYKYIITLHKDEEK